MITFYNEQRTCSLDIIIIENIQLLHECKQDRNEHLVRVIAEAQVDNDTIEPTLLPSNQGVDGEYEVDDIDDLIQLIGSVDEFTAAAINATKKSTENVYIRETVEAVEKVGRFNHKNQPDQHVSITGIDRQIVPFIPATSNLIKLNLKWQDQLKIEKERIRRSLISGKDNNDDDILHFDDVTNAVVTVVNPYDNRNNFEKKTSIPPVLVVKNNYSTQTSIIAEFTLNKEQKAAFLIITNHLDGDSRCRTGDNNGQLIMCIPGCGGTGKSQLIRALTKYFLITKRMQMMRKLAPTGIAAAEIDGMTIHS
ncbi:unnamed protein product, partial [Adineta ricciae]